MRSWNLAPTKPGYIGRSSRFREFSDGSAEGEGIVSRLSNLLRQLGTQDTQLAADLKREVEALITRRRACPPGRRRHSTRDAVASRALHPRQSRAQLRASHSRDGRTTGPAGGRSRGQGPVSAGPRRASRAASTADCGGLAGSAGQTRDDWRVVADRVLAAGNFPSGRTQTPNTRPRSWARSGPSTT